MDRDEFMELVYETFADEPDNVLANGIIEAADAYVEYEKAQLSKENATSDLISRQAAIDALDCISGVEEVLRSLPPAETTGHWIPHIGMNHECSACGNFFPLTYFAGRPFEINYCPHCGAKMKGERQK